MGSLGDIVIGLTMDNSRFQQTANASRGTLNSLGRSAFGVVGQVAGLLGVGGAIAAVGFGVKLAADAEQTQVAFEVMLGSADKAKSMLAELKQVSDKSPFGTADVQNFAKSLVNYGVAGKDVVPTIKMLGDVAAGDRDKFEGLSRAYGQISATGRLMGQDLNQLINAGFNPLQEISKKTGESMGDLRARMEAGGIGFSEVKGAFEAATGAGGRFFGMTERQSNTVAGKFSTLKDSVNDSLRTIGEQLITQFDMVAVLTHVTEFTNELPYLFRNAGSLIEIAVLDWEIYFYELVPAFEGVMETIGAFINATWDGCTASFGAFTQNLTAGLEEIKNLALATWESIKAGISAIAQGRNPLTAANDAFQSTLANQKQPDAGKNFATEFQTAFDKSFKNAQEGFKDGGGLAAGLKARKEELLNGIVTHESALSAIKKTTGGDDEPGNEDSTKAGKDKAEKRNKESDNKAALVGTSEAAKILLGGFNKDKEMISLAKQQIAATKETTKALASKNSQKYNVVNLAGG